jgi:ribose transport system ATP-binding protein
MSEPLFHATGLSKAYSTPVLKSCELQVAAGEVVALTGENGAGKSTLSKIVAGIATSDSGAMRLGGQPYAPANRAHAEQRGVRMVLQELSLVETLSVAENLLLGKFPNRAGLIRRAELDRVARAQLARVGLSRLDPRTPVGDLGIGQQQLVEIARGLMGSTRLLILDEPTAMLTAPEIARLFEQIDRLKSQGVSVIYISHRLDELSRIADRVVVLRDGALVTDRAMNEVSHDDIVRAMVGRDLESAAEHTKRPAGKEALRLEGISRGASVRNVSLCLHEGEIVGLAGLVGSGRTELLRVVFGADRKDGGEIYLNGAPQPVQIGSPTHAVRRGIALLTEDRKSQGLLLTQSLAVNLTIADLVKVSRHGWIDPEREIGEADRWMQHLRIRAHGSQQAVAELSGGNQQKALLARWLHRDCRVLLLDEPTRGIDAGARADIYALLNTLANAGKALLVVASDLRELMQICDRIAVMSGGKLVRIFDRGEWSEQALLSAAFVAHRSPSTSAQVTDAA